MHGGDEAHLNVHLTEGQPSKVNLVLKRLGFEQGGEHGGEHFVILVLFQKAFFFAGSDFRFAFQHGNDLGVEPHLQFDCAKQIPCLLEDPLGVLDFLQAFHHLFLAVCLKILDGALDIRTNVANRLRAFLDHGANFFRLVFVGRNFIFPIIQKLGHDSAFPCGL